jgi:hypothetical protein
MKIDLAVIGQGAVSPAGMGVDALLHREPVPVSVAGLGQPDQPWPVLRVDVKDPAFVRWQGEPRLRRASSITFFLVEAAEQALAGVSPADRAETGLIVAFSAGCITYSRRFFEGIVTQGMASPALFPETVFNSPVSHVASVLNLNGAAYALAGDETAWVAALQTASIWLQQERVRQVLILGAEEFDPIVLDAYRSARWLRRQNSARGFLASEGAAGILARRAGRCAGHHDRARRMDLSHEIGGGDRHGKDDSRLSPQSSHLSDGTAQLDGALRDRHYCGRRNGGQLETALPRRGLHRLRRMAHVAGPEHAHAPASASPAPRLGVKSSIRFVGVGNTKIVRVTSTISV